MQIKVTSETIESFPLHLAKQQLNKNNNSISSKSWDLNLDEQQFLNDLYKEIQETQLLANNLLQATNFENEQIEFAEKDIQTVRNVIDMLNEESDKEDDIRFAIDNALLDLATTKRKTEDENSKLKELISQRNRELRMLIFKVKDQDQEMKKTVEKNKNLEYQMSVHQQTLRQLQNKVEDENRIKLIQEQFRKPKNQYNGFVDSNANDPFNFWQNNNIEEPNNAILKKDLWLNQKLK